MAPARRRRPRRLLLAALGFLLVCAWAAYVEPSWIEVTRHVVALPIARPLRLAHLTDLHTLGIDRTERRLLEMLAAERPDVIVITGDTLHESGSYAGCRPLLSALHAPLGVFMVPGNWETGVPLPRSGPESFPDLRAFLRDCGVTLLRNESVELAPGTWLVGLDDFVLGLPDLARATAAIPAGAAKIALVHEPGWFDESAGGYDLLLAGHTHGGQVRIPFLPPLRMPAGCGDYVAGWYELRGSRMFVSRGIGMSRMPLRLCCRPELAILELTPSK